MNLANELLPPLPQGTISLPASTNLFVKGSPFKKSTVGNSGKQEDSNGDVAEVSPREKLLNDQPQLLQQFGMDLLPVLIQVSFPKIQVELCPCLLPFVNDIVNFCLADIWIQCKWPCSP